MSQFITTTEEAEAQAKAIEARVARGDADYDTCIDNARYHLRHCTLATRRVWQRHLDKLVAEAPQSEIDLADELYDRWKNA